MADKMDVQTEGCQLELEHLTAEKSCSSRSCSCAPLNIPKFVSVSRTRKP